MQPHRVLCNGVVVRWNNVGPCHGSLLLVLGGSSPTVDSQCNRYECHQHEPNREGWDEQSTSILMNVCGLTAQLFVAVILRDQGT